MTFRDSLAPGRQGLVAALGVATALAALACGDGGPSSPARVDVSPSVGLLTSVGTMQKFTAQVVDEHGASMAGVSVAWSSSSPSVATIDASTGVATAQQTGVTTIAASVGMVSGEALLEVYLPLEPSYIPGQAYFGRRQYIEYVAGDLPIIVSAPHGGYEEPVEIPDRTWGTTSRDRQTQELARAIGTAVYSRTGRRPHVVISRLHRSKLDPNRGIDEAAQGNPFAEWAWNEFHGFIEAAEQAVEEEYGRGLYVDLHGHGHDIQRLELGYLLSATDLARSDAELAQPEYVNQSSIRTLALEAASGFVALLRGPTSLGGLLAERGFPSVPSPAQPDPGGQPYFSGGYNTRRHGSRDGGPVSGVQLEANWLGVRDSPGSRDAFGAALAEALAIFFSTHFGVELTDAAPMATHSEWGRFYQTEFALHIGR